MHDPHSIELFKNAIQELDASINSVMYDCEDFDELARELRRVIDEIIIAAIGHPIAYRTVNHIPNALSPDQLTCLTEKIDLTYNMIDYSEDPSIDGVLDAVKSVSRSR